MTAETMVAGPYAHAESSIRRTMLLVMLALAPATLFSLWNFGWPAVFLFLVTVASALLAEALCLRVAGKPLLPYLTDGSALLTGWLLAMSLPPWAPWWIGALGAFIAIVVAKHVFGGLGQNLFNPAMVARVALLIAFPAEMTRYVAASPLGSADAPGPGEGLGIVFAGSDYDAATGATVLGHVRTELGQGHDLAHSLAGVYDPLAGAVGTMSGSLGETSALLILLGGIFLVARRVIGWHIPAAMLGTVAVLAALTSLLDPSHYPGPVYHLLSGALLLGAFFIATDPVTSPVSIRGQLLFGAGCGLLVFAIRTWAAYPEGVAFAVMLMNACTPLIDHYTRPRVYGRDRKGKPIEYADGANVQTGAGPGASR